MSEQFDVYEPGERKIYRYFDGKEVVRADPTVVWRNLMEVKGDLAAHYSVAFSGLDNKGKPDAIAAIARLSRKIFSLKEFGDGGLTEMECVHLVNHFWAYCDRVKKNSRGSPTPPEGGSGTPAPTSPTSAGA
jgi:hypothetical protein